MAQSTRNAGLTPELLAQFSAMLREQRRFRQEQLSTSLRAGPDGREAGGSAAQAEIDAVLRRGAVTALTEIDAALDRMQRGSYGRCTRCGSAISIERLEVLPQTARCIGCERRS